jgi:hypothetical protein
MDQKKGEVWGKKTILQPIGKSQDEFISFIVNNLKKSMFFN